MGFCQLSDCLVLKFYCWPIPIADLWLLCGLSMASMWHKKILLGHFLYIFTTLRVNVWIDSLSAILSFRYKSSSVCLVPLFFWCRAIVLLQWISTVQENYNYWEPQKYNALKQGAHILLQKCYSAFNIYWSRYSSISAGVGKYPCLIYMIPIIKVEIPIFCSWIWLLILDSFGHVMCTSVCTNDLYFWPFHYVVLFPGFILLHWMLLLLLLLFLLLLLLW